MTTCQNSQKTIKDVNWRLHDAYELAIQRVNSDRVEEINNQLATLLEGLTTNYRKALDKHKLLTEVYEQSTEVSVMEVSSQIKDTLSNIDKESYQLSAMTSLNMDGITKKIEDNNQTLQLITQRLNKELDSYTSSWICKIGVAKQILKIPDLVEELGDEKPLIQCINSLEECLSKFAGEHQDLSRAKEEWKTLTEKFAEYKNIESFESLKENYGFSIDTIEVIKTLLSGKEISLSAISSNVLTEIKKFEDFCNVVKLDFQTVEEER
ncbi:MAG: hypothetical protein NWF04_01665 [Candidatus Bathyarchaeota archaeon]|nr:hypothetical protein [Candidatus Bathyarchaeota archaeon]